MGNTHKGGSHDPIWDWGFGALSGLTGERGECGIKGGKWIRPPRDLLTTLNTTLTLLDKASNILYGTS